MPTVEVPANEDTPAGTAAPTPLFVQLQHHPIEHERVVSGDGALFFVAENLVEVLPTHGHEGTAGIGRGAAKARIVVWDEARAQIAVRGGEGPDPGDPQLVDQAL